MSPRPTAAWRPINEWLFSRAVLPVCILAWTILAFREGVGVSDRDAVPDGVSRLSNPEVARNLTARPGVHAR